MTWRKNVRARSSSSDPFMKELVILVDTKSNVLLKIQNVNSAKIPAKHRTVYFKLIGVN